MASVHGSSLLLCGNGIGVPGRLSKDLTVFHGSSLLLCRRAKGATGQWSSSRRRLTVRARNASTSSVKVTNNDLTGVELLVSGAGLVLENLSVRPERVQSRIGLVAAKELRRGEELFAIPKKSWITVAVVKESAIGKAVEGQRPWVCLALFLLWERRNQNSEWRPYLELLPSELNSTLFWSDEELMELQGTQLLGSTLSFREFVETEFERVNSEVLVPNSGIFDPKLFTLEAFTWAFGVLRSRTFPPLTGEELALVPFADLLNHGTMADDGKPSWELRRGTGFFGSQDALVVKAQKSYEAGQEVLMDYGSDKGNGQLALEYGFVESTDITTAFLGSRTRDCFTLTLEIPETDRFFDDKADVAELNKHGASVSFDLGVGQGPPEDMLTYLRLMVLDGPDAFLLEALFREAAWGHISLPVSKENEEGICTAMLDGCRSALEGYTTSVDEDVRLLENGIDDPRLEIAVVVRLGEKRVLQELQGWFEAHLARLDQLEYYAERRLRDLGLLDDKGFMTPWVFNE